MANTYGHVSLLLLCTAVSNIRYCQTITGSTCQMPKHIYPNMTYYLVRKSYLKDLPNEVLRNPTMQQKIMFETRLSDTDFYIITADLGIGSPLRPPVKPICGLGHSDSGCGTLGHYTAPCGTIKAFVKDSNCQWSISVGHEEVIQLNIRLPGHMLCRRLVVEDIGHQRRQLLADFPGKHQQNFILSHSNKVQISFNVGYSLTVRRKDANVLHIDYHSLSARTQPRRLSSPVFLENDSGTLNLTRNHPQIIFGTLKTYQWHMKTPYATRVKTQWQILSDCKHPHNINLTEGPSPDFQVVKSYPPATHARGSYTSSGFNLIFSFSVHDACKDISFNVSFQAIIIKPTRIYLRDQSHQRPHFLRMTSSKVKDYNMLYRVYRIVAPRGKYIRALPIFNIARASHYGCSHEGFFLADGPVDSSALPGTFQDMLYGKLKQNKSNIYGSMDYFWNWLLCWNFNTHLHHRRKTVLMTSSNQLTVVMYSYKPVETSENMELTMSIRLSVTDCLGVTFSDGRRIPRSPRLTMDLKHISCAQFQDIRSNIRARIIEAINFTNGHLEIRKRVRSIRPDSGSISYAKLRGVMLTMDLIPSTNNCTSLYSFALAKRVTENLDKTCISTRSDYLNHPCGISRLSESIQALKFDFPYNSADTPMLCITVTCAQNNFACMGAWLSKVQIWNSTNDIMTEGFKYNITVRTLPTKWRFLTHGISIFLSTKLRKLPLVVYYSSVKSFKSLYQTNEGCPDNYVAYKSYCYGPVKHDTSSSVVTWKQARDKCENFLNGNLLSVTSVDELDFIHRLISDYFETSAIQMIYIGMRSDHILNVPRWIDGSPVSITDWHLPWMSNAFHLTEGDCFNKSRIHPAFDIYRRCSAMLLTKPVFNNGAPWVNVPCLKLCPKTAYICKFPVKKSLTDRIIDEKDNFTTIDPKIIGMNVSMSKYYCPLNWTLFNGRCYRLFHGQAIDENVTCAKAEQRCRDNEGYIAIPFQDDHIATLLQAWNHEPMYGGVWVSKCQMFVNVPRHGRYPTCGLEWILRNISVTNIVPNVLCERPVNPSLIGCGERQFQCNDGSCIWQTHVCNGIFDCPTGTDESSCTCDEAYFQCTNGQCIKWVNYCDGIKNCVDNSDEHNCTDKSLQHERYHFHKIKHIHYALNTINSNNFTGKEKWFTCKDESEIPMSYVNDSKVDCIGPEQEDEMVSFVDLFRGKLSQNGNSDIIRLPWCPGLSATHSRCRSDHTKCFPRDKACVKDRDVIGHNRWCPDGGHLRGCGNFDCPNMFKCPDTYCVPVKFVCDGKIDCPGKEDEVGCNMLRCRGFFRCRGESFCLDKSRVCDGVVDCGKTGDDEAGCTQSCPSQCQCSPGVIDCQGHGLTTLPDEVLSAKSLRVLLFTENMIQLDTLTFSGVKSLGKLVLKQNDITLLENNIFTELANLILLDLSYNKLGSLKSGVFDGLSRLQHLILSGNPLKLLQPSCFKGLSTLTYLNLSNLNITKLKGKQFSGINYLQALDLHNNLIDEIDGKAFSNLPRIKQLDLRKNRITKADQDLFSGLKLRRLDSDEIKFCCLVDKTVSFTPRDEVSSCDDLMGNLALRLSIWVIGLVGLLGNLAVIIWRVKTMRSNTHSFLVVNLAIFDLLMGIYLLILASVDLYFRGIYVLHEKEWRQSVLCKTAGVLSALSGEGSIYVLLLITSERLASVLRPFRFKGFSKKLCRALILSGWCLMLLLSVLPVTGIPYFGEQYIKQGVCLLIDVTGGKSNGWEYTLGIFMVFNLSVLLFMVGAYASVYILLYRSRLEARRELGREEFKVYRRFLLIIITNFITWIPVLVVFAYTLSGASVPSKVAAWLVTFVMPVNSALNPYFYTFAVVCAAPKKNDSRRGTATTVVPMTNVANLKYKGNTEDS